MNLKKKVVTSTFFVAVTLSAVVPARADWKAFNESDGLCSNEVHVIYEDRSERMWFGTDSGVSCYDGVEWIAYTRADGLCSNNVYAICEDGSGSLWFGTPAGVSRFDGTGWRTYTETDGLADNSVGAICEDTSGNLWFGTSFGGVSRFDGTSWTTFQASVIAVSSICEDHMRNLWFGFVGGVSCFDGANWSTYGEADGLAGDVVGSICEDGSGDLWFGTNTGLSRFDGTSWRTYTEADGLAGNIVNAICEDSSGNLWFGTDAGVSRFDRTSWRTYTDVDGLGGNVVRDIIEDSSGNLWFGVYVASRGKGVNRYDGVGSTTYTEADGLAMDLVQVIDEDISGNLWFGTNRGVSRFDGTSWRTYTEADGLASNSVRAIRQDRSGSLWFGTSGGVSRFDGVVWRSYTEADELANDIVLAICEDSSGNIWFGTHGGVSCFDGTSWRTYTEADGLASNSVYAACEDSSGNLWFGTAFGGVSRFDGESWTTYKMEDGLCCNYVYAIADDSSAHLWFGGIGGVSRFDGVDWSNYTVDDGLVGPNVQGICEDMSGNLWFGTLGQGASCWTGELWRDYTEADGLVNDIVRALCVDSSGALWFGTSRGVTVHEPDVNPPQTVIWPKPLPLTGSPTLTLGFLAGFKETEWISFSYSFDGSPWSEWSTEGFWTGKDLADGEHIFQVKARDGFANADPTPAVFTFEVDATPPTPLITLPASGQAVRDSIGVIGTADDMRFESYVVMARRVDSETWELLAESDVPVIDGMLAGWNTSHLAEGDYELRLSVTDTLGLTGRTVVRVIVDNEPPWAYETAPVLIKAGSGGDVYTTNREAHLYFPPNGFLLDTEVRIEGLGEADVPDTLVGGAVRVLAGYEVSWGDSLLAKPATLELSYDGMEFDRDAGPGAYPDEAVFAIYMRGSDSEWLRLGGTVDTDGRTISASLTEPGLYSVFAGGQITGEERSLSTLSITPRVFSPSGGFASSRAAIGFTLGRPAPVTVKVYNRAGRLVREVASEEQLNAGANLLHWDGRRSDGDLVEDGIYLVTVEALGQKQVKPLAVVR